MKQYLKLELLIELPADLEVELIKPPTPQVDHPVIVEPEKIIMEPDKKMTMTVSEIAEELQVSTTMIYTMVRQKEIPHIKVLAVFYFIGLL